MGQKGKDLNDILLLQITSGGESCELLFCAEQVRCTNNFEETADDITKDLNGDPIDYSNPNAHPVDYSNSSTSLDTAPFA